MDQIFVFKSSPEEDQASILKSMQSQIDQLKVEFQPKQPTQFVTRLETANLLGVDVRTVDSRKKKKKIKAYHYGYRVFFKRHEILKFITNKL